MKDFFLINSDTVRLVEGTQTSGRLEIYNKANNTWETVCESRFDNYDAKVVCTQLGHGFTNRYSKSLE